MADEKKKGISRRDLVRAALAGGAASSVGVLAGDVTHRVQLEEKTLALPRWDADGFRVAVIADLHMDSESRLQRALLALRMAKDQRPDAILVPGDYITASDDYRMKLLMRFVEACSESPCPIVGTLGNHDYWNYNPERVIRTLRCGNLRLLRNERMEIGGVTIAGIDDGLMNRHRPDEFATKGQDSRSLLAMFHEPDYVSEVPDHISLQISGHSHGGQVRLPFGIAIHTPKGARRYIDGYYPNARVPLFVTRGIGTTGPDFRLYCPPQVAVLTLKGA